MMIDRCYGYTLLGLKVRKQKKRKRVNGRARGFYEEKTYVYVRVRLPDGRKRDIYLGRQYKAAESRDVKTGVEKPTPATSPRSAPARSSAGWRKRVQKDDADDTRDEFDPRQREMFGGARRR